MQVEICATVSQRSAPVQRGVCQVQIINHYVGRYKRVSRKVVGDEGICDKDICLPEIRHVTVIVNDISRVQVCCVNVGDIEVCDQVVAYKCVRQDIRDEIIAYVCVLKIEVRGKEVEIGDGVYILNREIGRVVVLNCKVGYNLVVNGQICDHRQVGDVLVINKLGVGNVTDVLDVRNDESVRDEHIIIHVRCRYQVCDVCVADRYVIHHARSKNVDVAEKLVVPDVEIRDSCSGNEEQIPGRWMRVIRVFASLLDGDGLPQQHQRYADGEQGKD